MKRPLPSLREELLTARARLRHQIDILHAGPRGPNMSFQPGMAERLQEMVDDIDEQLSELEDDS